jgi:proteasome alpha subunit
VRAGVAALAGPDRTLPAAELEVALLARGNGRRCFRRLDDDAVAALLTTS